MIYVISEYSFISEVSETNHDPASDRILLQVLLTPLLPLHYKEYRIISGMKPKQLTVFLLSPTSVPISFIATT